MTTPTKAYTPGPWKQQPLLSGSENDKGFSVTAFDGIDGRTWIADVSPVIYDHGNASEEGKANARLIAAAPELLQACKAALLVLDGGTGSPGWHTNTKEMLGAVIARAEGRTP